MNHPPQPPGPYGPPGGYAGGGQSPGGYRPPPGTYPPPGAFGTGGTIKALNDRDVALSRQVSCAPSKVKDDTFDDFPDDAKFTITGDPTITGATARVPYSVSFTNRGKKETTTGAIPFDKRGGRWCVGD